MTYTHTHTTKYRKIQVKKITKRDENRTFVLFSFKFDTIVSRSRFITVSLPPSIYLPIPRYSSVQSSKIVNPRLPFNFSSISQQFKGEIVNREASRGKIRVARRPWARSLPTLTIIATR